MKKWTALLIFLLLVLNLLETCRQIDHLDGCNGAFVALVAMDATRTILGLLHGICGDEAKDYGNLTLGIQVGNALCGAGTHVVEVGRVATYHAAEGDDCIHLAALYKFCRAIDEFKAARDGVYGDVGWACAMAHEGFLGAVEQGGGDVFVPFRNYDAKFHC